MDDIIYIPSFPSEKQGQKKQEDQDFFVVSLHYANYAMKRANKFFFDFS